MNGLTQYINSRSWVQLYPRSQQGLALGIFYTLFRSLERDQADRFWFSNSRFVWSKEGTVLNDLVFRLGPDPPFSETLRLILEADTTIASFIEIVKEEDGIVECVIHL